jgi:hypothetical protein
MMNAHKITITMLIIFMTVGCSPAVATPSIQESPTEIKATVTAITPPTESVTVAPSATIDPAFSEGCINLTETTHDMDGLNGFFVVYDNDDDNVYFLDPKSNQLIDIETQIPLSWDAPDTDVSSIRVSPNKKFIQAHLAGKDYDILATVNEIVNTYSTQGQEDWNGGRWLDNEHMVFQNWLDAPGSSYKLVVYDPFTGEQKNMRVNLPDPFIVEDTGGKFFWVKANIDPSLKRVFYNTKDERLVLWDLDNQKEGTSLPAPTDVTKGTWSPDGSKFAIPSLSPTHDPTEYFIVDMDGTVKKTSFNQKYPFANVESRPKWSPDSRYIAFQMKTSNLANPNSDDLRQLVAIMDTTTLNPQIYCLSGGVIWSPDGTQVIIDSRVSTDEVKPVLVDLERRTQSTLDTHGLTVIDWVTP